MALLYHNNNSISNVTSFAQVPAGDMQLLSTATASSSASIEFNSTYINSDYKIYKFEFIDIHPSAESAFQFQGSTNNGSSYGITITSTYFSSYHTENDVETALIYNAPQDLAQSTSFQRITYIGNNNDESSSGYLHLFNPSSTTYVKHFIARNNETYSSASQVENLAGYFNTTSAINAIKFQMSSGNIDAGQIKLYGIGAN